MGRRAGCPRPLCGGGNHSYSGEILPAKTYPLSRPCRCMPSTSRAGLGMTQGTLLAALAVYHMQVPVGVIQVLDLFGYKPIVRSYITGYSGLACEIKPRFYGVPMGTPVISSSADPMNTIETKSIKNAMAFENTLAISREPSSLLCGPVGIIKQVPHINNPTIILRIRLESMPII